MYRDDCKYFCEIETEYGDSLIFCKRETNRRCNEAPVTLCEYYKSSKRKRKWLPQFIKKEEFTV